MESYKSDNKRLFDVDVVPDATRWMYLSLGFAASGIIGLWTGYASWTLNAYIGLFGLYNVCAVFQELHRLRHHIGRSEQIFWEYSRLSVEEILAREEFDRPIAWTAIQAKCLKAQRGLGDGHESIVRCLEQTLLCELNPVSLAAKVLPAMGLVGTCLGMMGTLSVIGVGAANGADVEAISQAVSGSLPSMTVAISTTLAAAFCGSVVLMGLVHLAKSKVHNFVDELNAQLDMFPIRQNS